MIAISSLSAVSAGLFDGLFGNSQNNITNISGFQFNIPDGYQLNNDSKNYINEISWDVGNGLVAIATDMNKIPDHATVYNHTVQNYTNAKDNKTFEIFIESPFNGTGVSNNSINSNKTINGIEGQFKEKSDNVEFIYIKNSSAIHIKAPDESLISNIIVNK